MILTIDIGNTTTAFGLFARPGAGEGRAGDKGKLKAHFAIGTQSWRVPEQVALHIRTMAVTRHADLKHVSQALVCSVVPRMTDLLTQALRIVDIKKPLLIGRDVMVPLKNKYEYPEQVGQDRLVGAYAALMEFKQDCIVCDFGTAVTIDIVKAVNKSRSPSPLTSHLSPFGEYLGGVIAPGLGMSLDALNTRTALLPRVELTEPPELLGRDTVNSIRSGVVYGWAALCDGLVGQLKAKYAPKAVVVATGGDGPLIAKYAHCVDHVRPHLVLEGLSHLASAPAKKPS